MGRAAADLLQEVRTPDGLVEGFQAQRGEDFAHVFGDEAHQVDDLVRRAAEPCTEGLVLRADADRAGVRVALAHHDAAHRDERRCTDTVFFGAEHSGDHNVTPGAQAAIRTQSDLVAQIIQRKNLMGFGEADFPGKASILDRSLRARARAANTAGDKDDVGLCLRNTGGHRTDAGLGNQLHADAAIRVDLLQIIDQLREVFDRIDVMVRRR